MPKPAKKEELDLDTELLQCLYRFKPDIDWLASFCGVDSADVLQHKDLLSKSVIDRNSYVEFSLFYLATVKKDVRAMLAWLEANDRSKYGKGAGDDISTVKSEILAYLASNLPD